ncbi:MAG: SufD family Fe-S cluster assembly protein, partial [Euryarchaeota archaeon]|nr:SufD family Fe-S cluster assembly protein [Euryarchaeota archaeon]
LLVRRVVRAGKGTRVCYSEELYSTQASADQRLYSSAVHATTGPGAQLVYLTVHAPDANAVAFYSREAATGKDSRLGWVWSGFGGMRTNYRNITHLANPGSEADDLQTVYGDGESAFNNYVEITHDRDATKGQSITRGVFKDHSRGTSRGMMRILPKTQKVVSYLSEHGMLLSRTARCETAPDLEILSSMDVKATHSSSVAPIDQEKIFYLESRGIERKEATRMITEGFLSHVLDRAPVTGLREVLYPIVDARWNGRAVVWAPEGPLPDLPPLGIVGWGELGDWRMDTKLRDTAGRA